MTTPTKEHIVKEIAQKVFLTEEGKKMFGHILLACGTNRHSFVPGDQYATAFRCGQQSIGFWLISLVEDKWEVKEKQEELEKRVEKMCRDNPGTQDFVDFYKAINSPK